MIDIRNRLPRNGTYATRQIRKITKIAIHWDAQYRPHEYDSVQRYINQANYHIRGGADGFPYHYSIDNVGDLFHCRNHKEILWNVGGDANGWTLAVKIDCGANQKPTRESLETLKSFLEELCFHHPEFPATQGDVMGHREFVATACPGNRIQIAVNDYNATRNIPCDDVPYDWKKEEISIPSPKPLELWRVFNNKGDQVGAYEFYENAKNKIVAIQYKGYIKHPDGKVEYLKEPPVQPIPDKAPEKPNIPIKETPDIKEIDKKLNFIIELLYKIIDYFKRIFKLS